jgi:hypothetical protein
MTDLDHTTLTAMRIADGQTNLHVDVTICRDGDTFVSFHDADHGTTVTLTLADFRRAVAAVDRRVN